MRYLSLLVLLLICFTSQAQVDTCDLQITAVSDTPCSKRTLHLAVNSIPNTTYTWEGPGGWNAIGDTVTRDTVPATANGDYIVTGVRGICTYIDTVKNVFIRTTPPTPTIISTNLPVCVGDTLKIMGAYTGGTSIMSYFDLNGNSTLQILDTMVIPNIQYSMEGIYGAYGQSISGCYTDTLYFPVAIDSNYEMHAISDTPCSYRTLHLSVDPLPNVIYTWEGPGGWTAVGDTVVRDSVLSIHVGNYIVTGTRGNCTFKDTVKNVFVKTTPLTPYIILNTSPLCVGETLKVLAAAGGIESPAFYLDSLSNMLPSTNDTLIIPNIQIDMAGLYYAYISGTTGCSSDTITFNVHVDSCTLNVTDINTGQPFIPSVLQPHNAVFKPIFATKPDEFTMQVYDQAGRKVFETTNTDGWDRLGYRGMYYYIITTKSGAYKGRIMLL